MSSTLDRELALALGWLEGKRAWGDKLLPCWLTKEQHCVMLMKHFHPSQSLDQLHDIVEPEIESRGLQDAYARKLVFLACSRSADRTIEQDWHLVRLDAKDKAEAALEVLKGGKG